MDGKPRRGLAILNLLVVAGLWLALAAPCGAQSAPDFTLKDAVSGQNYSLK